MRRDSDTLIIDDIPNIHSRRHRNGLHRELGAPSPEAPLQRHSIDARFPQPVRHTGAGGFVGSIAINHSQTATGALGSPLND